MSMSKKAMLIWTVEKFKHQTIKSKPQLTESYSSKEPNKEKINLLVDKVNDTTFDVILSMNVEDDPDALNTAKNMLVNVWAALAITRETTMALKRNDFDYEAASRKEECDLVALCREISKDIVNYVRNGGKLVPNEEDEMETVEIQKKTVETQEKTEETEEEDSMSLSLGETYDMDSNTQVFTIDCNKD